MKLFKKVAIFITALLCMGFSAAAVACDSNNSSSNNSSPSDSSVELPSDYIYRVKVKNAGGYGFKNVTVKLMDGETVVATTTTHSTGYAYFEDVEVGNYTVVAEGYPDGYGAPESAHTIPLAGTDVDYEITPLGLREGIAPVGTYYQLGDVMYDFTLFTAKDETFTLSDVLAEKELVVINFWATWCGPCKNEFPAMQNALIEYADLVDCIAVSTTDSKSSVLSYQNGAGYTFNMAAAGSANLATYFNAGDSIPQTYLVDRYGVIVLAHTGSMTAKRDWTVRFDKFLGDDYEPYILAGKEIEEDDGTDTPETELVKPNVAPPAFDAVQEYLGASDEFTFRWQPTGVVEGDEEYDEYSWPWVADVDEDGAKYLRPANKNVHSSYSILYMDYTVKSAGEALAFDYKVGTEERSDILYVLVDGVPVKQLSGNRTAWQTCYAYVFEEYEVGTAHEIVLIYQKDSETTVNEDLVCVNNLRIIHENEIPSNAGDNAHVFRNAANVLATGESAKTAQYTYYAKVALNENDKYYHVDSNENGIGEDNEPILFANLLYTSPWNSSLSAWLLAYNNFFVVEGATFAEVLEPYAWEANQPTDMYGYAPVTEELRSILELMVEYTTYGENWDGAYHENEWLEVCCYYQHYGDEPYADPMKGITFHSAIELKESTADEKIANEINLPYSINPRGFKYKFTAKTSGVYHIYSEGNTDAYVFVANEQEQLVNEHNDKLFINSWVENGTTMYDFNFDFHMEMQAGETWYFLCANYSPEDLSSYNVYIEYAGTEYSYLTSAGSYWSQNLVTGLLFIGDAIEYVYSDPTQGGDGYYHKLNEDGTMGSIIYLSTLYPTYLYTNSLYQVIENWKLIDEETGEWDGEWKGNESERPFYFNGVDYTSVLNSYCYRAMQKDGEMKGFIEVDQRLFEILQNFKDPNDPNNTWLMMCYYVETIVCENA